jgi:hypothetical protein
VTGKPLMVLVTLIATTGYLALAVWGAGGIAAFFSEPARIALVLVGFALGVAALREQIKRVTQAFLPMRKFDLAAYAKRTKDNNGADGHRAHPAI